MSDLVAFLGKSFLDGVWSLFDITVPGFSVTFGGMWIGFLLASLSVLVVRFIFSFDGGMMTLLLLTSVLGYELKTAVGTSVFIHSIPLLFSCSCFTNFSIH